MTSTWAESVKSKGGSYMTVYILANSLFFSNVQHFKTRKNLSKLAMFWW